LSTNSLEGRRVLYISYNGMLDPLGQSQVLPYLRELSKAGVRFTLLSFERDAAWQPEGRIKCENLKRELATQGIEWHQLRYHQKPSLPATFYDVVAGVRYASKLVRRNRIEMVHARSNIPATIAHALKKRFGIKMIFDVRGLMAEEYTDAGHWREGSVAYRLTKTMERRTFRASDGIVTLTEAVWPHIKEWDGLRGRVGVAHQVIPCCTDLERFKFNAEMRAARRAELGVHDRFLLVYSGTIGAWYLSDRMADFFVELLRQRADAHFLWLTLGVPETITELMRARGITASQYTVRGTASSDVASYLSASDAGLAFYKPGFSKLATSPVKVSEYLACGLPFAINAGIGDSDALVRDEHVGALVKDFTPPEYAQAAATLIQLAGDAEATRRRTRAVAEKLFDVRGIGVKRYSQLYKKVLRLESE
jgi:glycosyltransferase involved in cell wall biosynthesis